MDSQAKPHSHDQFGPQRDFWWNGDCLDLMARRWRLHEAGSLADIGCGPGHWSIPITYLVSGRKPRADP